MRCPWSMATDFFAVSFKPVANKRHPVDVKLSMKSITDLFRKEYLAYFEVIIAQIPHILLIFFCIITFKSTGIQFVLKTLA